MSQPGARLRVAMIGHAFMGAAHSAAWRTVGHAFDLPQPVELAVVCGRDAATTSRAAQRLGWADWTTDWQQAITQPDIDIVDVCTPVASHAEIAIAALNAGKHVLCEKPLANDLDAARRMVAAAEQAEEVGVRNMLGHNYRRIPALALLQKMISVGELGAVRHLRATYAQDWGADPDLPMSWRFRAAEGGSGALADLGSHLVDLVHFITGEPIVAVSGASRTFITERPSTDGVEPVDVDDATLWTAELAGGGLANFETSRVAIGRKNNLQLVIFGEHGAAAFDLERLNELEVSRAPHRTNHDATTAGRCRILVTEPEHPYLAAWWPPGHVLGWEHTFIHQARDFIAAINDHASPRPSFADGLAVQTVLDAVTRSALSHTSVAVGP